jgi:hypothetical protein
MSLLLETSAAMLCALWSLVIAAIVSFRAIDGRLRAMDAVRLAAALALGALSLAILLRLPA